MPPAVKAILFDLDDTLVASSNAYGLALAAVGIDPSHADYLHARSETKRMLGASPSSRHRLLYFKRMHEAQHGAAVQPAALLAQFAAYERHVAHCVADSFRALRRAPLLRTLAAQCRLGVVTNETTRMQVSKWAAFDPAGSLFSAFVTSEEVGREKPDEMPFLIAAQRLRVEASACWFVGDDVLADVVPAARLGMRAFWATELLTPEGADRQAGALPATATRLGALSELRQWLNVAKRGK